MKRLHVHVGVGDLGRSIGFYSKLFRAEPAIVKKDYARWMLDYPRVNFAISSERTARKGIEHLGIQAEDQGELAQVYARMGAADRPVLEEGRTTCCYAKSEKSWIADPDGIVWEAFFTDGEATVYGGEPGLEILAALEGEAVSPENDCCDASTPQGVCCAPNPELPADAACCG
jgi:hypothetical protein